MKAREIRERLKGKVDPEVLLVLEALAIQLGASKHEMMELAAIQDKMMDLIMQLGVTIEGATNAVDKLKKIRGLDN